LNPTTTTRVIERFGERKKERLGDRLGKRMIYIFVERLAYM
jgi:hypothetical protein